MYLTILTVEQFFLMSNLDVPCFNLHLLFYFCFQWTWSTVNKFLVAVVLRTIYHVFLSLLYSGKSSWFKLPVSAIFSHPLNIFGALFWTLSISHIFLENWMCYSSWSPTSTEWNGQLALHVLHMALFFKHSTMALAFVDLL